MGRGFVCGGLELEKDGAFGLERRLLLLHRQLQVGLVFDSRFRSDICIMLMHDEPRNST